MSDNSNFSEDTEGAFEGDDNTQAAAHERAQEEALRNMYGAEMDADAQYEQDIALAIQQSLQASEVAIEAGIAGSSSTGGAVTAAGDILGVPISKSPRPPLPREPEEVEEEAHLASQSTVEDNTGVRGPKEPKNQFGSSKAFSFAGRPSPSLYNANTHRTTDTEMEIPYGAGKGMNGNDKNVHFEEHSFQAKNKAPKTSEHQNYPQSKSRNLLSEEEEEEEGAIGSLPPSNRKIRGSTFLAPSHPPIQSIPSLIRPIPSIKSVPSPLSFGENVEASQEVIGNETQRNNYNGPANQHGPVNQPPVSVNGDYVDDNLSPEQIAALFVAQEGKETGSGVVELTGDFLEGIDSDEDDMSSQRSKNTIKRSRGSTGAPRRVGRPQRTKSWADLAQTKKQQKQATQEEEEEDNNEINSILNVNHAKGLPMSMLELPSSTLVSPLSSNPITPNISRQLTPVSPFIPPMAQEGGKLLITSLKDLENLTDEQMASVLADLGEEGFNMLFSPPTPEESNNIGTNNMDTQNNNTNVIEESNDMDTNNNKAAPVTGAVLVDEPIDDGAHRALVHDHDASLQSRGHVEEEEAPEEGEQGEISKREKSSKFDEINSTTASSAPPLESLSPPKSNIGSVKQVSPPKEVPEMVEEINAEEESPFFLSYYITPQLTFRMNKLNLNESAPRPGYSAKQCDDVIPNKVELKDLIAMDAIGVLLTTYKLDLSWLLSSVPALLKIPSLIIHGEEGDVTGIAAEPGQDTMEILWRSILQLSSNNPRNPPPPPFRLKQIVRQGNHYPCCPHGKLMLIRYPKFLRVVISTANLYQSDYERKTQGLWFQDFPLKCHVHQLLPSSQSQAIVPESVLIEEEEDDFEKFLNGNHEGPSTLKRSNTMGLKDVLNSHLPVDQREKVESLKNDFLTSLKDYLTRLHPQSDLSFLERYDYSNVRVVLLTSVLGTMRDNLRASYGHLKLANWLSREPPPKHLQSSLNGSRASGNMQGDLLNAPSVNNPATVFAQMSSIGAISRPYLAAISASFKSVLAPANIGQQTNLKLIWPTTDFVRKCVDGYSAGGSLCAQGRNILEKPWVLESMCLYQPPQPERFLVPPHIKSYWKYYVDGSLGWMCLTSANLSKSAWGEEQQNGTTFYMNNFEIGVLFLPSLLSIPASYGDPVLENDSYSLHVKLMAGPHLKEAAEMNRSRDKVVVNKTITLPIPFNVHAAHYPPASAQSETQPWAMDVPRNQADNFGQY